MGRSKKIRFFVRRNPKVLIGASKSQIIVPVKPASLAIILLLSVISIYFALRSDVFQVRNLQIKNLEKVSDCVTEEEIYKALDINGKSVIFADSKKLSEKLLANFGCLKSVNISSRLPNKIEVDLKARKPVATVIASNSATPRGTSTNDAELLEFFLVDDEAFIVEKVATTSSLPKILLIKNDIDFQNSSQSKKAISTAIIIITELANYQLSINQLTIDQQLNLSANFNENIELYFGNEIDPKRQVSSLQAILRQAKIDGKKLKRIDLRFAKPHVVYN